MDLFDIITILITLGLVTGGYSLAGTLYTSGPLAMVAAGLLIGNHGRRFAMSETTRKNLDTFWELVDEIINAVLFVFDLVKILTWGGLRGGIAVALALSLPPGRERGMILVVTYMVVVFSIAVQGLTLERLLRSSRIG